MPPLLTCQQLLECHPQVWQAATMLVSATEPNAQDDYLREYYLTAELIRLTCLVLDAAPKTDLPWLFAGLAALKNQLLGWQTRLRPSHNEGDLDVPIDGPQLRLLIPSLAGAAYPVLATLLWALTLAQQQRWQPVLEADPNQPDLTAFLEQLAGSANHALAQAEPGTCQQTEAAFLKAFTQPPR
jgi:formylaminopyrimidine deformylase / aminopyrimidine aminohydrolase